jgi:hypothetical protein
VKKKSFEFFQKDEEFKQDVGCYPCFRVVEFEEAAPQGNKELIDAKKLVTKRKQITIHFDYPLTNETKIKFKSKTGFTLKNLFKCIYNGYTKIYKEEGEDPGMIDGMYNRRPSNGKYGIWGYVIDDLYLEGATEVKPGEFELSIGS